jgi:hypothetical protein
VTIAAHLQLDEGDPGFAHETHARFFAEPYGEWLPRGLGEDVVSGTHDPLPLAALAERQSEIHMLQTRSAKRSPLAAVRIVTDLVSEGVIEPGLALRRVSPEQVRRFCSCALRRPTRRRFLDHPRRRR